MHIKHIHCMIEKIAECAVCEVEKGTECLNTKEMGEVADILKDLCEAEYYAHIAKAMGKAEEEEQEEEKFLMRKLKEEYGEEEGERRYYDRWRYKSGRFAPKGKGSRRGYEEPPYYHMTPEMYREHGPEYWRDLDRNEGRMYYSGPVESGSTGIRDHREGKSWQSRRAYMESKETHPGSSPEEKQHKTKELEKYMNELSSDVTEMIAGASNEEKTMLKTKMQTLLQKI